MGFRESNESKVTSYLREMSPVNNMEIISNNGDAIEMNVVSMREIKESTGEASGPAYFTTLSVSRAPQRIVGHYDSRWEIENCCNCIFSQT